MTLEDSLANLRPLKIEAVLFVLLLAVLPSGTVATLSAAEGDLGSCVPGDATIQGDPFTHTIMHYTPETLHAAVEVERTGQRAAIDPSIAIAAAEHFDLLSHLQYSASDRDQGYAGNCWVWAGTGVMEIALDAQEGIKDRLSIQYFDSNYYYTYPAPPESNYWAGCGGILEYFAEFYSRAGEAVPWSNTNAGYGDYYQSCPDGTAVLASSISTSPDYSVSSIQNEVVPSTHGAPKDEVITNIKNVLHQGKAIWFAFTLPDAEAWNEFGNFWWYQPESMAYDMSKYDGYAYDYYWGGGHAVLLVGYDDTNPADSYWIMVNSWGTAPGRPNGIFHVKMDMDYDTELYDPWSQTWFYNLWWQTLDIDFTVSPPAPPPVASATVKSKTIFDNEFSGANVKVERRESGRRWRTTLPTPFSVDSEGLYKFTAPSSVSVNGAKCYLARWEDESGAILSGGRTLVYDVQSGKTFYAVCGPRQYRLTVEVRDTISGARVSGATVEVAQLGQTYQTATNSRGKAVIGGIYAAQPFSLKIVINGILRHEGTLTITRNTTYRAYIT